VTTDWTVDERTAGDGPCLPARQRSSDATGPRIARCRHLYQTIAESALDGTIDLSLAE